ncbi:hypothetical protein Syun_009777 [Stephania yunnanensis]|uniref:Wax synthase domain-containing protein n=1 Tax=Stephania yunnanensis TaxID=152371 RepID=A0AAP0KF56_9MAGN
MREAIRDEETTLLTLCFLNRENTHSTRSHLHPNLILALYSLHVYLNTEILLTIFAAPTRALFKIEIEPQFDEPYLSTSLQDFRGRRWNLMVTGILRPIVYDPVRLHLGSVIGKRWGSACAVVASFVVSGLTHELIYDKGGAHLGSEVLCGSWRSALLWRFC